jgi:hypothetical protein
MDKKRYKLWFLSSTILVSMIGLLLATQSAAASISRWAIWKIDVTFPNNKIQTDLIISLGHTTQSGQKVIDYVETFPVSCQAAGNPVLSNDQATFDGSSYYECAVPNIRSLVYQMPGHLIIPATCDAKRPYVHGTVTIEGNPTQINPDNPLYYRDDIQASLPFNTGTQKAEIDVAFANEEAISDVFTPTTDNVITAIYLKASPGSNTYVPTFVLDGTTTLASTPTTITAPIFLSTLDSTIYIGYSPTTGNYFEGSLGDLQVDPVCIGQG